MTPARPASAPARRAVLAGLGGAMLGVAGWTGPARATAPVRIVATTGMIADAARTVAGSGADVTALMGPGLDPHSYRPTRSDIALLARADLVLWHGLGLEAQLAGVIDGLAQRQPVLALGETLPPGALLADPDFPSRVDPHVWMDPALWAGVAPPLVAALDALAPGRAGDHAAGAQAFAAAAAALDAYARQVLDTVPAPARVLVTAHDAFGYFGRAYGWQVEGVQGLSTEGEAGLARIAELVEVLVGRGVAAVFVESSVSDRAVRALVEGAAARGHRVAIGGELFSDAMGPAGSYEGTWPGMIDHNVTLIARALGGEAPVGGLNGRLAAGA